MDQNVERKLYEEEREEIIKEDLRQIAKKGFSFKEIEEVIKKIRRSYEKYREVFLKLL